MKKKKMNIADFKKMNEINLEAEQMRQVTGGFNQLVASCTLETVTCTPSGNSMDGDDSWDGEC